MKKQVSQKYSYIRLVVRPIVGYCLRNAVPLQELVDEIKQCFVDVAIAEMKKENEKVNVSRISIRTGVHRRDVASIFKNGQLSSATNNFLERVVGQWETDKRFLTQSGRPRSIPIEGRRGTFEQLVGLVSKDIHPGTALYELERTGMVKKTRGNVSLQYKEAETQNVGEGLAVFVRDAEDLMSAVEKNVYEKPKLPNHHVRTEYDNVSVKHIPQIRSWLLKEGAKFHRRAREYISKYDKDLNPKLRNEGGARVVIGSFSRAEEEMD